MGTSQIVEGSELWPHIAHQLSGNVDLQKETETESLHPHQKSPLSCKYNINLLFSLYIILLRICVMIFESSKKGENLVISGVFPSWRLSRLCYSGQGWQHISVGHQV